ncbi:MAG: DUF1232 domain-containing protein [Phycisphaerae bacterium]|nr:DUF1232 domain-containing protein [Phycisphaerae bacterium]
MTQTPKWSEKARAVAKLLKREVRVYRLVLKDPRTPWLARVLLGLAVGYVLLPFDLIPDFIPVLGHLDDVIIVPALVMLALRLIPKNVITENRMKLPSS